MDELAQHWGVSAWKTYTQWGPEGKGFWLNALKPYGQKVADIMPRFGLDTVATLRSDYRAQPDPHFRTYGPRNRREFLNLMRWGA